VLLCLLQVGVANRSAATVSGGCLRRVGMFKGGGSYSKNGCDIRSLSAIARPANMASSCLLNQHTTSCKPTCNDQKERMNEEKEQLTIIGSQDQYVWMLLYSNLSFTNTTVYQKYLQRNRSHPPTHPPTHTPAHQKTRRNARRFRHHK
jgi:hypothetical protein